MIKLILAGIWVCLVTLGSTYAVVSWQAARPPEPEAPAPAASASPTPASSSTPAAAPTSSPTLLAGLEAVKTKMISVPIVTENAVQGYVMAQFVFTVDSKVMKRLAMKPDVFLVDEAFKAIYEGGSIDFRHFKKQDLAGLTKQIAGSINKRLGVRLIDDVLVQDLNYIPKDQVRGGQKL